MSGTKCISLARGGAFPCAPEENILDAGRKAGFNFPHACRNGVCERCAGNLLSGEVSIRREPDRIRAGEEGSDRVLYCVATPLSDCEIDVPDVLAPGELPVHELSCQVVEVTALSADVSRVMLRLPAGRKVEWYPGQYLELLIPAAGDSAFSIACAPGARDIELHVRTFRDNSSSVAIMETLQTEPTVRVRLPGGVRYLASPPGRPVTFICGSTGFAPIKAMLEFLQQREFRLPIRLYWGARTREDLYLEEMVRQWEKQMPNLKVTLTLSDTEEPGYFHGMVHEAVLKDLHTMQDAVYYVGGSPPMAWAVFDALTAAGVPAHEIHSDVFDYAPRG